MVYDSIDLSHRRNPKTMYIFLSSDASKSIYAENKPASFRTKLSRSLILQGAHEIALINIRIPKLKAGYKTEYIIIKSSICQDSLIDSSQGPLLARIFDTSYRYEDIAQPCYVPLNAEILHTIDIYLLDSKGTAPSFEPGQLYCTLHIRKCHD